MVVSELSLEEAEGSPEPEETKNTDAATAPRREGLRPRHGIRPPRLELSSQDYENDDQNSSDREMGTKGKGGNLYNVIFFCLGYGCFVFVLSLAEKSFPPGLGSLFR